MPCQTAKILYNTNMDILDNNTHTGVFETVMAGFPEPPSGIKDPTQLGPLVLAYIGDTVFDLYVRSMLIARTDLTAHGLHMAAAKRVCAAAQAACYKKAEAMLTEEESAVFRRGRNSHMGTIPKNASIGDYRAATGLEAVIGWLYLKQRDERLNELMRVMLSNENE